MDAVVSDPCKLLSVPGFDSKSVGTFSPVPKQESQKGLFVDRGVGSPRLIKSAGACIFTFDRKLDCETKVCSNQKDPLLTLYFLILFIIGLCASLVYLYFSLKIDVGSKLFICIHSSYTIHFLVLGYNF